MGVEDPSPSQLVVEDSSPLQTFESIRSVFNESAKRLWQTRHDWKRLKCLASPAQP